MILILHETPGDRYSLIPGDVLSKGSKINKMKLGEMKTLKIDVEKKVLNVQRKLGECKDYEPEDSQAKCYLDKVLRPRHSNVTEATRICADTNIPFTGFCLIPQALNIFKNEEIDISKGMFLKLWNTTIGFSNI